MYKAPTYTQTTTIKTQEYTDMKMDKTDSILSNEKLAKVIAEVAETAGYLWEKGWAERNGGNITVNVTDCVDGQIKNAEPISEPKPIGMTLPHLKGCYFLCKGTNRRMRDLARKPLDNSSIIRICDDCASYVIVEIGRAHV